jgi:hypothetical protein
MIIISVGYPGFTVDLRAMLFLFLSDRAVCTIIMGLKYESVFDGMPYC